jgi:hypothetical protein
MMELLLLIKHLSSLLKLA